MIYKQKFDRCFSFFGITDPSGLMPLSRYLDNGLINNGHADRVKEPEAEKPSVLEQLKALMPSPEPTAKEKKPEERNIG